MVQGKTNYGYFLFLCKFCFQFSDFCFLKYSIDSLNPKDGGGGVMQDKDIEDFNFCCVKYYAKDLSYLSVNSKT